MPKQKSSPASIDLDLYEAVFAALAEYRPGYVVSAREAVAAARERLPKASRFSDDALIELLVSVATTNQMLVSFDNN